MIDYVTWVSALTKDNQPRDWRWGQYVFNDLHQTCPELANKLRGLPVDPFYRNEVALATYEWIENNWGE